MYDRLTTSLLKCDQSFFLFGPRGVGKTTWLKQNFKNAIYLDLLDDNHYQRLQANPTRLNEYIPSQFSDWIILDEIQKIPALLNEVHRLIENNKYKFILTGSSARSLRKKGVNLLGGRALTYYMFPLTALELGQDFNLPDSLLYGHLPGRFMTNNPRSFLNSYIQTYLREEVLQEGLTRNIGDFSRFLEYASFSQGNLLNFTEIAREASIKRLKVASYFSILEDLLIAYQLPVFNKKAKRRLINHHKFYFFDVGIFQHIRPKGLLDHKEEMDGIACETLVFQELKAFISYQDTQDQIFFWRTSNGLEVDFIIYGENKLIAIEVKRNSIIRPADLKGLKAFKTDYPMAKCYYFYLGTDRLYLDSEIEAIPLTDALKNLDKLLI